MFTKKINLSLCLIVISKIKAKSTEFGETTFAGRKPKEQSYEINCKTSIKLQERSVSNTKMANRI